MVLKQPVIGYHVFLNVPEGNCSGSNLVTAIQELLNSLHENFIFEVVYNPAEGLSTLKNI